MSYRDELWLHQSRIKAWERANWRRYFYEKGAVQDYTDPTVILAAAYTPMPLAFSAIVKPVSLN